MQSYDSLIAVCKEVNRISALVVDEFLMYYAANREGLEREMNQRLSPFRHVIKELPQSWINLIKGQYIVHRIFKKGGLIKKYLNHASLKALPADQLNYLHRQSEVPWRYCYSVIIANPSPDFYDMEDVFTGERFLLYSPSVTQDLVETSVSLWFNLIAFNGSCWQTFGPILPFKGFEPDDIFFFATELNLRIESEEDLLADLDQNPFPYLMLISGSNYPFTVHEGDIILQVIAEHQLKIFDSSLLKADFKLEYANGVFRITNDPWGEAPHFAAAYFVEDKQTILLTSLTDRGFRALADKLTDHGFIFPDEPDIRVHPAMVLTIDEILGKKLRLNPYEERFTQQSTPAEKDSMDKLNRLLSLAIPFINAGQSPDVEALAKEAGVDIETARDLLGKSMERINTLWARSDKKGKK